MQLYALDQQNKIQFAGIATKQQDYFCLECRGTVRLRGGTHRHFHFYHLSPNPHCHQSGKSMVHLQTQWHLLHLLPERECFLEYHFPKLKRIADVVWMPQKIVFEIQCSSIPSREVEKRNQDYKQAGLQVIWILHDRCFNQWRVTAAELCLRNSPVYFTNINSDGEGIIYDQIDVILKGVRKTIVSFLPIDPRQIYPVFDHSNRLVSGLENHKGIVLIQERISQSPFYIAGDVLSLFVNNDPTLFSHLEKTIELKSQHDDSKQTAFYKRWWKITGRFLRYWVIKPYLHLFKVLLENSAR